MGIGPTRQGFSPEIGYSRRIVPLTAGPAAPPYLRSCGKSERLVIGRAKPTSAFFHRIDSSHTKGNHHDRASQCQGEQVVVPLPMQGQSGHQDRCEAAEDSA